MHLTSPPTQAGARVMVQDVNALPLPDEYGYNVLPNTQTILALQEVRYPFVKTQADSSRI